LSRWDSLEIFLHVLFPDVAHRNSLAVNVCDRNAVDSFAEENTLRMMAKSSMSEMMSSTLLFGQPPKNGYALSYRRMNGFATHIVSL
jgi:hypothetical protein